MTIYTDDFDRADSGTISDGTHPWVEVTGRTGLQIVSHRLSGPLITARSEAWFNVALTDDHYVEFEFSFGHAESVYFRGSSSGPTEPSSWYEISWDSASGGSLYTRTFNAGVPTARNTTTGVGTISNGDRVRCQIQGSTIKVYFNGVQKASFTDTTFATGQYVGLRSDSSGNVVDNFAAGPL